MSLDLKDIFKNIILKGIMLGEYLTKLFLIEKKVLLPWNNPFNLIKIMIVFAKSNYQLLQNNYDIIIIFL